MLKKGKERKRKISKKPIAKRHKGNKANIKIVGVGGGGGNAISRMKEDFIRGVEFIAINTDVQDLEFCNAHKKLAIGKSVTRGLGTGMNPDLGRQAAEENKTEIAEVLQGADLVFVTVGLGGGTGSGASPIIAETAKEIGALTIAVVTKPFTFEGGERTRIAEEALLKIKEKVDAYIIIPNDRIFTIIGQDTSINQAFKAVDNVLRNAVQGIAELITMPGLINVDFADVKTIMQGSGESLVGVGIAGGKERGAHAVQQVLEFPLLDVSIEGAKGILFGISGGRDLKMSEVNEIAKAVTQNADPAARIIFGAYYDRKVGKGKLRLTLIATGFGALPSSNYKTEPTVESLSLFSSEKWRIVENKEDLNKKSKENAQVEAKPSFAKDLKNQLKSPIKSSKEKKKDKKTVEIWDIPAFLRRRKNK